MKKLITIIIFFFAISCFAQDTIKTQYVITNWGKANTKYTVEYTVKEKSGKIKLSKVNKSKLKDLITISKKKKSKKGGKAGGFGVKSEVDSTQFKKLVSDYEMILKTYQEKLKKWQDDKDELKKMEGMLEYIQYQIQEEKKKIGTINN